MRRARVSISIIACVLLFAVSTAAGAQSPGRIPTVGVVRSGSGPDLDNTFEQSLHRLGWVRNQNLRFEVRHATGRRDAFAPLVAELVAVGVDVLVAWGPAGAVAAKRATSQIPVVFLAASDPLELGLVSSLARPGGNLTGISFVTGPEIAAKRLQLLKEVLPSLARVAVLFGADGQITFERRRQTMTEAAKILALELHEIRVEKPDELEAAVQKAKGRGAQALFIWPSGFTFSFRQQLSDLALVNRLPSLHGFRESITAGGLLSYAPSLTDIAQRGAAYVDKILRGARPGDLPVEQPTKFELVINAKTAIALGLTVPPGLLLRADAVVE